MSTAPSTTRRASRGRGFSLIELLVVIVIIAIVIGITVPAIGGARDLARASSTQSQLAGLGNAISSFRADEQRLPGYFNAQKMGQATTGFSGMQNIMLDLAGGPTDNAANALTIGPGNGDEVLVNLALIGGEGGTNAGYFDPGDKWVVVENKTATGDTALMPELVDAWGMPILAWAEDEFAPAVPDVDPELADFAALTSAGDPARFYWSQNATLVSSDALGPRDTSQAESLLRVGTAPDGFPAQEVLAHMAALLGSPADPINPGGTLEDATVGDLLPGSAKGGVVLHSAGRDRVYLSTQDAAYSEIGGEFVYGKHFSPDLSSTLGDSPWTDADGGGGNRDIAGEFNDVITNVGG